MRKIVLAVVASLFVVSSVLADSYDLDFGEKWGTEETGPWILAALTNLPMFIAGAVKRGRSEANSRFFRTDYIAKLGYGLPRGEYGFAITTGPEVYFPTIPHVGIGFGFALSEHQGTPQATPFEGYTSGADTYVVNGSVNLRVDLSGIGFLGAGIGYFWAEADRKWYVLGTSQGRPLFGSGPSYQLFAGIMEKRGERARVRFLAEIRYTVMRTNDEPVGYLMEMFHGKDFGGLYLCLGLVF